MKTSSPSAPALRWALPSWTAPGTAADNARLLEGRVPEIGLCFFETKACLAYGDGDIPPAGLRGWDQDSPARPMRYHVHLPADGISMNHVITDFKQTGTLKFESWR